MTQFQPRPTQPAAATPLKAWPVMVAIWLLLIVLWRDTALAMAEIWWRSGTYTHAFVVPLICVWLAWSRRTEWLDLPFRPQPLLLLPCAALCLAWLVADLALVAAASQFALVALIALVVPLVWGRAATRILLFPLAFLFFCVPFGDFLVPKLMQATAHFTVLALRLTGVPVYQEGLQFVIPSGNWSVVDACSGIRYLIASAMVGTLFAYLNYQSLTKRLIFIALSLLMPIVANWARAYLIVMIGHLSSNQLAAGVDHLVYGWVFFGLVIGLMFWIGSRWADPLPAQQPLRSPHQVRLDAAPSRSTLRIALLLLVLLVATQGWRWQLDRDRSEATVTLELPLHLPIQIAASGAAWQADESAPLPWVPDYASTSASASRRYLSQGRSVWVWVGYYRRQGAERKLVSSAHSVQPAEEPAWPVEDHGSIRNLTGIGPVAWREVSMRAPAAFASVPGETGPWQVRQTYWIDGDWVSGDAHAKLRQAWQRLRGHGDDGAVVLIATEGVTADGTATDAANGAATDAGGTLDTFVRAALPDLALSLAHASRRL